MDLEATVGPYVPNVIEQEIHGCVALLHPDHGDVVILNETASDIWRLSEGDLCLGTIVHVLASAYNVPSEEIRDEVERTVLVLRERGFLRVGR